MKLEKTVTINASEKVVLQRITRFMTQEGYRSSSDSNPFRFERGSALGSLISFNPKGWQTQAHVQLSVYAQYTN